LKGRFFYDIKNNENFSGALELFLFITSTIMYTKIELDKYYKNSQNI